MKRRTIHLVRYVNTVREDKREGEMRVPVRCPQLRRSISRDLATLNCPDVAHIVSSGSKRAYPRPMRLPAFLVVVRGWIACLCERSCVRKCGRVLRRGWYFRKPGLRSVVLGCTLRSTWWQCRKEHALTAQRDRELPASRKTSTPAVELSEDRIQYIIHAY